MGENLAVFIHASMDVLPSYIVDSPLEARLFYSEMIFKHFQSSWIVSGDDSNVIFSKLKNKFANENPNLCR